MRNLSFLVVLFVATSLACEAAACSCVQPPPPKEALAAAVAVFSGKVTEVKQADENAPKEVTIEIEQSWKGADGKSVVVTTGPYSAMCGVSFETGKSYLVYCIGEKTKLRTNLCTRTKTLEGAAEDLKDLGEGQKP